MPKQITVEVGEKVNIKLGFGNYIGLVYCGMPNENVFSLGFKEKQGYQGYGLNIFYDKNKSVIKLGKVEFRVISVSKERIVLELKR